MISFDSICSHCTRHRPTQVKIVYPHKLLKDYWLTISIYQSFIVAERLNMAAPMNQVVFVSHSSARFIKFTVLWQTSVRCYSILCQLTVPRRNTNDPIKISRPLPTFYHLQTVNCYTSQRTHCVNVLPSERPNKRAVEQGRRFRPEAAT